MLHVCYCISVYMYVHVRTYMHWVCSRCYILYSVTVCVYTVHVHVSVRLSLSAGSGTTGGRAVEVPTGPPSWCHQVRHGEPWPQRYVCMYMYMYILCGGGLDVVTCMYICVHACYSIFCIMFCMNSSPLISSSTLFTGHWSLFSPLSFQRNWRKCVPLPPAAVWCTRSWPAATSTHCSWRNSWDTTWPEVRINYVMTTMTSFEAGYHLQNS